MLLKFDSGFATKLAVRGLDLATIGAQHQGI
jgi:hypothetical protein